MNLKISNIIWGTLLLLVAVFILINQFDNFLNISFGGIIIAVIAIIIIVQCIVGFNFAGIPLPLAALYYIFQAPFDLPFIQLKVLIIASILASIGLAILIPKKLKNSYKAYKYCGGGKIKSEQFNSANINEGNNQYLNVRFGSMSRRIRADNLEAIKLDCEFGAMELFLDQAVLSPQGALADINCRFGAVVLFIPKNWKVIDQLNCSLGGVDYDGYFPNASEDAPQLTLTGNVSLGGVEIKSIS